MIKVQHVGTFCAGSSSSRNASTNLTIILPVPTDDLSELNIYLLKIFQNEQQIVTVSNTCLLLQSGYFPKAFYNSRKRDYLK